MAALDFPSSPTNGQLYPNPAVSGQPQYTYDGEKWTGGAGVGNVYIADSPPAAPVGSLWYESDTGMLYVRYYDGDSTQWVAIPGGPSDAVRYGVQTLTETQKTQARSNISAAPLDALAYSGMQINGSMEVSQENGLTPVTVSNKVPVDGWYLHFAGTMAVSAFRNNTGYSFPGTPNALTITVQTAQASLGTNDFVVVQHYIEGYRIARLEWGSSIAQPITLGFWTAHHRPGTYTGVIRNGAFDRGYAFTYTQNVADAAEYKTITIPGCPNGTWLRDNGVGMRVCFAVAAGAGQVFSPGTWISGAPPIAGTGQVNGVAATSDVFHITNLVVLPGIEAPSATRSSLIMRPFDQELLTCKRYWQQFPNVWVDTSAAAQAVFMPIPMRSTPTVTGGGAGFGLGNLGTVAGSFTTVIWSQTARGVQTLNLDARL